MKLVKELLNNRKSFCSRAMRKEIQHKLKRLRLAKAHQAVFVIKDLLGNNSANNSEKTSVLCYTGSTSPCLVEKIWLSIWEKIMVASQNLKSLGRCDIFHFILFYFYYYYFLSGEVAHQKQLRKCSTDFKLLRGFSALMHLLARNCYK